ncbi:hypothetical protein C1A40_10550 [Tamlana carrageenivorans]|uniref:Uncharacterized protein n=1 Tax=Pseudotamlana carrageenivorans TaxID=2069432 RepID=A0A2I7SIY6_9FLAO|nr:hypothetical protein C1A40_10550 [Tamlana carrageenivorans]
MKTKKKHFYITFLVPLLVTFIFEILFIEFHTERVFNLIENVIFGLMLLLLIKVLIREKWHSTFLKIALCFFSFLFLLKHSITISLI